jgi:phosphatidylglycerol:prolipoprotein diacylglycerol transferase
VLFNLSLFVVLSWLYRRDRTPGRTFASYLVLYGTGRFLLEYTRGDEARGVYFDGLVSTSQIITATLVAIGIVMYRWAGRRSR